MLLGQRIGSVEVGEHHGEGAPDPVRSRSLAFEHLGEMARSGEAGDRVGDRTGPARGLHHRVDALEQMVHRERLADVVVGATIQRSAHHVGIRPGGHHDHRDSAQLGVGLQRAQHGQAVDVGQPDVEEDHVRPLTFGGGQPGHPVTGLEHVAAIT